jgi:hypothetical protein
VIQAFWRLMQEVWGFEASLTLTKPCLKKMTFFLKRNTLSRDENQPTSRDKAGETENVVDHQSRLVQLLKRNLQQISHDIFSLLIVSLGK